MVNTVSNKFQYCESTVRRNETCRGEQSTLLVLSYPFRKTDKVGLGVTLKGGDAGGGGKDIMFLLQWTKLSSICIFLATC